MPTVQMYFDPLYVSENVVKQITDNLGVILSGALGTEPKKVTPLPTIKFKPNSTEDILFIDIVAKYKPEREENLEERRQKICRELKNLLPDGWISLEKVRVRVRLEILSQGTLAEAASL